MTTALTLVRLRWSLTWATLRKSVWQTVAYVFAMITAVATVIITGMAAWGAGGLDGTGASGPLPADYGHFAVLRALVVIFGSLLTVTVAFIQLMLLGDGSTMSPRKFALYGLPDRQLQFGLLLAGMSGLPAITGMLSLMVWTLSYRHLGGAAIVTSLVASILAVFTMMSLSKLLISLATTLVTSRRGKNLFYIVVVLGFVALSQLPNIMVNSGMLENISPDDRGQVVAVFASTLAWTPFGAAFQLPFDAAAANGLALLGHLAVLAVTWVVCFVVCTWCLKRERLTTGAGAKTITAKGIGAFGWMPDSVPGAVAARLFTYLKRDPRQGMIFLMPILFVVVFAFQARGESAIVWVSLIWSGWMLAIAESNGLAYDGRGFTMEAISGVRGLQNRIGRVLVYLGIAVVYLLVLGVGIAIFTGDWAHPDRLLLGILLWSIGLAAACCGLGLAEITSCVFMYPVPSPDKPFSSPQGRAMAQGFFPFIYLFGTILLLLPTGIVAIVLTAMDVIGTMFWVLIPIVLVNGAGMLALGTWLGGKLLDARMLSVVSTLDSFASLQH